MLHRNRFLVLLALAGLLAFLSLSLQFCKYRGSLRGTGGWVAQMAQELRLAGALAAASQSDSPHHQRVLQETVAWDGGGRQAKRA